MSCCWHRSKHACFIVHLWFPLDTSLDLSPTVTLVFTAYSKNLLHNDNVFQQNLDKTKPVQMERKFKREETNDPYLRDKNNIETGKELVV